jgi:hypothetical protein
LSSICDAPKFCSRWASEAGTFKLANELIDLGGVPGHATPGRKVLTLVHAMMAGADCIDDCDVLRSGATGRVLGHGVMAPLTLGTFLRAFTFGHVRQLDSLSEALLAPLALSGRVVIAETFDELLGAANLAAGNPGMTGTLTVRYRKPTPLRTDLRLEARCQRREGREIFSWAGIYHGDTLTAEADGLFIEVAPAQFLAIAEGNADSADPVMLAAIRAEALRVGAASDVHPIGE